MAAYPGTTGSTLSFSQIEQLWVNNGGSPGWAPLMAAVAIAESGGMTNNLNNNASTGDFSVGLWQINYFGANGPERVPKYGEPAALASDANAQAKAAVNLFGTGSGWTNWKNDAAMNAWAKAGYPQQPAASVVQGWGIGAGGNQAAGPGPGQPGFNPQSGGTQSGGTATLTATQSSSIPGVPDTPGTPPGIDVLNPIGSLASSVQWVGGLIGWAILINIVIMLGAVLFIMGVALLVVVIASPAIGPVTAAVGGKSPAGRLVGGAAATLNRGKKRGDTDGGYEQGLIEGRASREMPEPRNRRQAERQATRTTAETGRGLRGPSQDRGPGSKVQLSDGSWF